MDLNVRFCASDSCLRQQRQSQTETGVRSANIVYRNKASSWPQSFYRQNTTNTYKRMSAHLQIKSVQYMVQGLHTSDANFADTAVFQLRG
jgi:hypothetical protein